MSPINKSDVNNSIKNIIIIQIGKIGDMVLTIPLFYYLKQIYPNARLTVLSSISNNEIPRNLSYVDETIIYSKNILTGFLLLKSLRRRQFDLLIDLNYNYSRTSERILKTLNPKQSFGFNFEEKLYDIDLSSISKSSHLADLALAAVNYLNPDLDFNADAPLVNEFKIKENIPEFKNDGKIRILFNISAGSKSRAWSEENWSSLIKDSINKFGSDKYNYFITGLYADKVKIINIRNNINSNCLTYIKQYKLTTLFNIISSTNLLISPDTSLIHIASAYNIPVLGLYPDVDWNLEKFKPLSELNEVIVSNSSENIFDIKEKAVFEKYCSLIERI